MVEQGYRASARPQYLPPFIGINPIVDSVRAMERELSTGAEFACPSLP